MFGRRFLWRLKLSIVLVQKEIARTTAAAPNVSATTRTRVKTPTAQGSSYA
jgi:hypothetical protein